MTGWLLVEETPPGLPQVSNELTVISKLVPATTTEGEKTK